MIREAPVNFEMNLSRQSETKIVTCCCLNQGVSKIEARFEKNIYEPHEVCRSDVVLDNSKCTVDLTRVRLAVE